MVQRCLTQGRQTLENRTKWNCWSLSLLSFVLLLSRPFWLKFPPGWGCSVPSTCLFPAQPLGSTCQFLLHPVFQGLLLVPLLLTSGERGEEVGVPIRKIFPLFHS